MTTQRLIQNFRRSQGLLWAGADFNADVLERTLLKLGVSLRRVESVSASDLDPDRDIVFLDADQPINPAPLLLPGANLTAAPVIGIVGVEAPSRLKLLAEAGATAILRKPIQAATVYSALFLGVNNHRRLKSAETRLAIGDRKRRGRRFLIKAVVALVQARGLSDDDAYAELRRESMRRRSDLEEFCESLFQPDSDFPAAWPAGLALSSSHDRGGSAHAQDADVGRRDGGDDDDDSPLRRPSRSSSECLRISRATLRLRRSARSTASSSRLTRSTRPAGIAGRPLELVIYDTQSDNTRFQEFMRRVLQKDKVDVVFAGFSSASREAYRPIVDQLNGFAFYNNQYEGGVCDAHMIVTGAVPEQQFSTLIPWMMEKFGKKVYTIAADYNFGQISAEWVRNIVKQNGGEMVGEEFIPLGVSQFASTIQNIQKAKPDILITLARRDGAVVLLRAGGRRPTCTFRWAVRSMSGRPTSTSASSRRASPTCM